MAKPVAVYPQSKKGTIAVVPFLNIGGPEKSGLGIILTFSSFDVVTEFPIGINVQVPHPRLESQSQWQIFRKPAKKLRLALATKEALTSSQSFSEDLEAARPVRLEKVARKWALLQPEEAPFESTGLRFWPFGPRAALAEFPSVIG